MTAGLAGHHGYINGANPLLSFVHLLHRPIAMTDAGKATVWSVQWLPWGAPHAISGTATLDARFPGQWFQLEAGLHYNWHRHYDPSLGRYTQPDPLGFVDGPSVYGYARGNPKILTDKDGRNTLGLGIRGGTIGMSICGPVCAAVGVGVGLGIGHGIVSMASSGKPNGVPPGTIPIDQAKGKYGWDKDDVHEIKKGIRAGPEDWVGIDPDGNVWTGDQNNQGENQGPAEDYLPRSSVSPKRCPIR